MLRGISLNNRTLMSMLVHASLKDMTANPVAPNADESILMKWIMRLMRLGAASLDVLALEPLMDPEQSASSTTRTLPPSATATASVYMGP